ncbi:hypothetical protein [Chryseosolibacter indicus]|uniref:Uncharacterized protein n=1 Tax=Chryseosolibacter indicus TaxID=2782351 RepID=A0ABS5VVA7_9BACT|nr:hypothetical protein [Chryseosolibacter indicus]MBT1704737.1 hypothetical protein [Chryseosolibacter indicus]
MNKIVYFFFLIFLSLTLNAQSIYYDALKIREKNWAEILLVPGANGKIEIQLKRNEINEQLEIFRNYIPQEGINETNIVDTLRKHFNNNPFISFSSEVQDNKFNVARLGKIGDITNAIGGIDVTNYADALAQFMVERAREELNVAFFQKFKDYLKDNPEMATLFPETFGYISTILAHEYTQLINGLRDSFHQDLQNLIYNIDDVFLLDKYEQVVNDFPEILVVIRSIQIIADLEDAQHPADVIREFRDMKEWKSVKRGEVLNLHNLIKTTSLISDALRYDSTAKGLIRFAEDDSVYQQGHSLIALRDGRKKVLKTWSGERNWISAHHVELLIKDELALRLFLGLVYQKAVMEDIRFVVGDKVVLLSTLMKNSEASIFLFQNYFLEFSRIAQQTEEKLTELKEKKRKHEDISPDEYFEYVNAGISVIEYGFKVATLIDKNYDGSGYVAIMRSGNNLYRNVLEKNYSSAVTNALKVIELVSESIIKDVSFNVERSTALKAQLVSLDTNSERDKKKKDSLRNETIRNYKSFVKLNKLSKGAIKYGVFMANVVDAKSSEEIKEAISNAALPVGSSSYKKYQQFTLSVNSYLGAHFRLNREDNPDKTWEQNVGLIAPVGVALNYGLGRGGSVSLFAPLLDVGAIAEFRLSDTGTQLTESIKLGNILSPGGYVVYGLPANIPIGIGIGTQYGPGLFEVNSQGPGQTVNSYENPSWRWNAFVAVDIPLFNLTRGKKIGAR